MIACSSTAGQLCYNEKGEEMIIGIGNDHTAVALKQEILKFLQAEDIRVIDYGTAGQQAVDYPQIAQKVCQAINKEIDSAILICGTGIGMCISANKVKGIRAAVGSDVYSATLAKQHNNVQVLCLGARVIGSEAAKMIVDGWLKAEFQGGRHEKRLEMITAIEEE